jgi:uncharacterized membrane protein (UPF0127 family)
VRVLGAFFCLCAFWSSTLKAVVLKVGHEKVFLYEAKTPDTLKKGLMHVTDLKGYGGMLFILPTLQKPKFWMKDTPLPLDILFITPQKTIACVHENVRPYSLEHKTCATPVSWVIELKQGLSRHLNLKVGHVLDF